MKSIRKVLLRTSQIGKAYPTSKFLIMGDIILDCYSQQENVTFLYTLVQHFSNFTDLNLHLSVFEVR